MLVRKTAGDSLRKRNRRGGAAQDSYAGYAWQQAAERRRGRDPWPATAGHGVDFASRYCYGHNSAFKLWPTFPRLIIRKKAVRVYTNSLVLSLFSF